MTKSQIREIALSNGFKLKKQPDGSEDLHPYVYDFVAGVVERIAKDYTRKTLDGGIIYSEALYEIARSIKGLSDEL